MATRGLAGYQPPPSLAAQRASRNLPGGYHHRSHLWADVACASLCSQALSLFPSLPSTGRFVAWWPPLRFEGRRAGMQMSGLLSVYGG